MALELASQYCPCMRSSFPEDINEVAFASVVVFVELASCCGFKGLCCVVVRYHMQVKVPVGTPKEDKESLGVKEGEETAAETSLQVPGDLCDLVLQLETKRIGYATVSVNGCAVCSLMMGTGVFPCQVCANVIALGFARKLSKCHSLIYSRLHTC